MASGQDAATHSGFPDPPYFYRDFTPDRIERINQLRKDYTDATGFEPPPRLPELPEDLINLQPPAEPEDGRWRVFGNVYTLQDELPSLEEQQVQRLIPAPAAPPPSSPAPPPTDDQEASSSSAQQPPPPVADERERTHADRALILKRLAKSLLLNFLELFGVMSVRPDDGEAKLADIRTIFLNIEHAINEYRPHQAREQLIALMQEHLDRTRAETAALRAATDKTRRVLEGLGSIEVPDLETLLGKEQKAHGTTEGMESGGRTDGGDVLFGNNRTWEEVRALEMEREKAVWAAMDAAFA